jgi:predicted MFS family arabinose efflux permease
LSSPVLAEGVQRLVRSDRRGRVNAAINAATSLGVAAAAPAILFWSDAWREAYAVFAVLAGIAILAMMLVLPRFPRPSWRASQRMALPPVGRRAWRDIFHYGGLAAIMGLVSAPYWVFGPDFAVNRGGLGAGHSGWLWLAVGLGGLAGTWAGDLIDRHGPAISHGFALAGLSASLTLLASDPGNLGLAMISASVFGAAYMTLTGLYLVASVRIMPNRPALGPVIPLIGASTGQMAGSPIAGWLVAAQGYGTAFGLFAAIGLVMAVISLALPPVTVSADESVLDAE